MSMFSQLPDMVGSVGTAASEAADPFGGGTPFVPVTSAPAVPTLQSVARGDWGGGTFGSAAGSVSDLESISLFDGLY